MPLTPHNIHREHDHHTKSFLQHSTLPYCMTSITKLKKEVAEDTQAYFYTNMQEFLLARWFVWRAAAKKCSSAVLKANLYGRQKCTPFEDAMSVATSSYVVRDVSAWLHSLHNFPIHFPLQFGTPLPAAVHVHPAMAAGGCCDIMERAHSVCGCQLSKRSKCRITCFFGQSFSLNQLGVSRNQAKKPFRIKHALTSWLTKARHQSSNLKRVCTFAWHREPYTTYDILKILGAFGIARNWEIFWKIRKPEKTNSCFVILPKRSNRPPCPK